MISVYKAECLKYGGEYITKEVIMSLIAEHPRNLSDICWTTGIAFSTALQHMNDLLFLNLIERRIRSKWVYYNIVGWGAGF